MNVSHQTTEQLQANYTRTKHAESYGKSIAGQRLLDAIEKELAHRAEAEQVQRCGSEDCGDCNGCQPVNLCDRCGRKDQDCPIGGHGARECVEFRGMTA